MGSRKKKPGDKKKTKKAVKAIVVAGAAATGAAAKHAEELLTLIKRRIARITEDFFDIGRALKELRDKKLYVALGYASFDKMLAAREIIGATQAYKLIKVIEAFPDREEALGVGVEKGFALVSYAAATPATDFPSVLARSGLHGKKIDELSVRDIEGMTEKVKAKEKAKEPPTAEEKAAASAARKWQASLRKQGLRSAEVKIVSHAGEQWIEARAPLEAVVRWIE